MMGLFIDNIKWDDLEINEQRLSPNSNTSYVFYLCHVIKIFKYDESEILFIKDWPQHFYLIKTLYLFTLDNQWPGLGEVCISSAAE